MNQSHGSFPNAYVVASYALRTVIDAAGQAFVPGCFATLAVRGQLHRGGTETVVRVLDTPQAAMAALQECRSIFGPQTPTHDANRDSENKGEQKYRLDTVVIFAADLNSLPPAAFFEELQQLSPGCELVRAQSRSMSFRFYTFDKAKSVAASQ